MFLQCWSTVFDAGPTLKQHWVNALACERMLYGRLLPELTLTTLEYLCINHGEQRVSSTVNHYKCLS